MKDISQLGDYDAPFCEQQYTHGSAKWKNLSVFNPSSASQGTNLCHWKTKFFEQVKRKRVALKIYFSIFKFLKMQLLQLSEHC